MERRHAALRLYGQPSDKPSPAWEWVDDQLSVAGTYWVVTPTPTHPHPRPVWGVWWEERLHLSVGSPTLAGAMLPTTPVTVHLDSGIDVVIVEGNVVGPSTDPELIAAYDSKYTWEYDVEQYGPLTTIAPTQILAWRSAGWAGRDGFQETGRWIVR
jgi:hypothetical protein